MSEKSDRPVFEFEFNFSRNNPVVSHDFRSSDFPVMPIASVSKWFVALAIGVLVDQGDLGFEVSVSKFLPDFPGAKGITVVDLLRHRSGLPELYQHAPFARLVGTEYITDRDTIQAIYELCASSARTVPALAAKHEFFYSNTNYILLGEVVRRATGSSLASVLREFIFVHLQMKTAQVGWSGDPSTFPTRSVLDLDSGPVDFLVHEQIEQVHLDEHFYDGNILVFPSDIQAFFMNGCGRSLVSNTSWSKLLERVAADSNYACGVRVEQKSDGDVLWHCGSWLGFQAGLAFSEDGARGLFRFRPRIDPKDPNAFSRDFANTVRSNFSPAPGPI